MNIFLPNGEGMDPVLADRQQVLRRTLRGLSTTELTALAAGLRRHRGNLVAGRLFGPRRTGGCAVGVMLLELDAAPRRGTTFWTRRRWRRSHPRLRHLEWVFDGSVERLREATGRCRREAIDAVGRWFESETEHELAWRGLAAEMHPDEGGDRWRPSVRANSSSSSSPV